MERFEAHATAVGERLTVRYISCTMEMIRKGGKGRSEVDAKRVTVENGARRLSIESARCV